MTPEQTPLRCRLTVRRLEAICCALGLKLADELEEGDYPREDYETAKRWANEELKRRRKK